MINFDRVAVKVVASAGLFAATMALSPVAAAAPFPTGGYQCVDQSSGAALPPGAVPCAAAAVESSGVVAPLAPPPVVPPVVPPVAPPPVVPPVVPPVAPPPVVPPIVPPVAPPPIVPPVPAAAPAAGAAPITIMGGAGSGKGVPTGSMG